jgi:hypothetical protein
MSENNDLGSAAGAGSFDASHTAPTASDLAARIRAVSDRIPPGVCEWAYRAPKPVFFGFEGQWHCACGWANHELRKKCRNCGVALEQESPADERDGVEREARNEPTLIPQVTEEHKCAPL